MHGDGLTSTLAPERDAAAPLAAILLAMDRLLTAGALYPEGHGRFGAAVAEYRDAASSASGARPVVFEVDARVLRIQGEPIGPGQRGLERLLGLFDKLGILQVRIDADAPAVALHLLATRLLRQRREADANGHLKQAVFADLPAQVTVVPRTFRKRWSDDIDGRYLPVLETVLDEIEASFGDRAAGQAARGTLERMFRVFLARSDEDGEATLCAPEDRAFFESMISSGPQALCRALRAIIARDGDLGSLEELFDDSHEALASAAAQSALQLLLDAMAGSDRAREAEAVEPEARRVDDDSAYTIPLAELQATFEAIAAESPPAAVLGAADPREEISIHLAILALGAAPAVARQAMAGLWHAISRMRASTDREFLREKALSLLETADTELLDLVLPRLAGPFRDRGVDDIADYWGSLAAGSAERVALVWPHVVTELLRTEPETAMRGRSLLQSLATMLPPEAMLREASRFESLSTFLPSSFNQALFYRPRPVLYPVYTALLRTSLGATFGQWLHEGWSRMPADTAGGLLTRIRGPYRPGERDLYDAVLEHGQTEGEGSPPRALLDAVHLAVDRMPAGKRNQEWLPVAILVLGQWSPASSRRLLDRIERERRLLVLPAWPRACRRAARLTRSAAHSEGNDDGH